jgi:hypothetical protein
MIAKVIAFESAEKYEDKQRRLTLRLKGADGPMFDTVRFPEKVLGIGGLKLDDEIELNIMLEAHPNVCRSHHSSMVYHSGPACPLCLTLDDLDETRTQLNIASHSLEAVMNSEETR